MYKILLLYNVTGHKNNNILALNFSLRMTTLLKASFILVLSFLRHPNNQNSSESGQLSINRKTGPKLF